LLQTRVPQARISQTSTSPIPRFPKPVPRGAPDDPPPPAARRHRPARPRRARRLRGAVARRGAARRPLINEFVFNHVGIDTDEFVEIAGDPGTDYSAFDVVQIEGDGTGAGVVDSIVAVGTTNAAGYFFAGFHNNLYENGTVTLLLVEGFTGSVGQDLDTDNDGVFDLTPWARLVDAVAVTDGGSTDRAYAAVVLGPGFDGVNLTPGGASRLPDRVNTGSAADWTRNDFDGAGLPGFAGTPEPGEALNTPGAANQAAVVVGAADPKLNEFVANHAGTDTDEYVEVYGDPATDYSAFTILQIEGDGAGAGVVDSAIAVGTTDAAGFWVTPFLTNVLENGTLTLLLVEGWSGAVGADLDTDNDGTLDAAPWDRVVDSVAVSDGGASDRTYSPAVLAPGYDGQPFTPGGASRFPDGADTDAAADWVRNDFDGAGLPSFPGVEAAPGEAVNTPGAPNQVVVAKTLVINEVDYDQPGTDTAEFIEIKNVGAAAVDLSAYEVVLVNGANNAVYLTIALPAVPLAAGDYFVVCANAANTPNCDLDVSPNTNLIQNGAPDAVAIVSGGVVIDALSYEGDVPGYVEGTGAGLNDSGANDHQGLSRFPDGVDTDSNSDDFSLRCITPGAENTAQVSSCPPPGGFEELLLEIWEIQGSGTASPHVGALVTTLDNVVTAVGPDGFTIQTPDERIDADPATSDGVFVFTGGANPPAGLGVVAGARVDVTGTVQEFFQLTEIAGAVEVTVVSCCSPLPAPVAFDAATPPSTPSGPVPFIERYEGMLVTVTDAVATAGTDRFGDLALVATGSRAFREPGILFPGLPGLPVWDGNPEVFEVDFDRLLPGFGAPLNAGAVVSATGPLGFAFGDYQIWPTAATWTDAEVLGPVRPAADGRDDGRLAERAAPVRHLRRPGGRRPDCRRRPRWRCSSPSWRPTSSTCSARRTWWRCRRSRTCSSSRSWRRRSPSPSRAVAYDRLPRGGQRRRRHRQRLPGARHGDGARGHPARRRRDAVARRLAAPRPAAVPARRHLERRRNLARRGADQPPPALALGHRDLRPHAPEAARAGGERGGQGAGHPDPRPDRQPGGARRLQRLRVQRRLRRRGRPHRRRLRRGRRPARRPGPGRPRTWPTRCSRCRRASATRSSSTAARRCSTTP
jgi:hypothetical protein